MRRGGACYPFVAWPPSVSILGTCESPCYLSSFLANKNFSSASEGSSLATESVCSGLKFWSRWFCPPCLVGDFSEAMGRLSTCTGVVISFLFALSLWLLISYPREDHLLFSRLRPAPAVDESKESCLRTFYYYVDWVETAVKLLLRRTSSFTLKVPSNELVCFGWRYDKEPFGKSFSIVTGHT